MLRGTTLLYPLSRAFVPTTIGRACNGTTRRALTRARAQSLRSHVPARRAAGSHLNPGSLNAQPPQYSLRPCLLCYYNPLYPTMSTPIPKFSRNLPEA